MIHTIGKYSQCPLLPALQYLRVVPIMRKSLRRASVSQIRVLTSQKNRKPCEALSSKIHSCASQNSAHNLHKPSFVVREGYELHLRSATKSSAYSDFPTNTVYDSHERKALRRYSYKIHIWYARKESVYVDFSTFSTCDLHKTKSESVHVFLPPTTTSPTRCWLLRTVPWWTMRRRRYSTTAVMMMTRRRKHWSLHLLCNSMQTFLLSFYHGWRLTICDTDQQEEFYTILLCSMSVSNGVNSFKNLAEGQISSDIFECHLIPLQNCYLISDRC